MKQFLVIVGLGLCSLPALSTDLTLSVGYQFNSDFELAGIAGRPPEISPDIGEPGDDLSLDDTANFSFSVDFVFADQPNKRIGFLVTHAKTRFEPNAGLADPDLSITHLHFTAMSYYPRGNLEPFVMAGIGAGYFSPRDDSLKDETMLSGQIAAGTNYRFSDHMLLRLDVRWIPTFFDGGGAVFCSGGCVIALSSDLYSQVQANIGLMYRF